MKKLLLITITANELLSPIATAAPFRCIGLGGITATTNIFLIRLMLFLDPTSSRQANTTPFGSAQTPRDRCIPSTSLFFSCPAHHP